MKFTADREALAKGVSNVLPAINIRSPKEVLQNIRIDAVTDGVMLHGTNLETWISTKAEADIESPGSILIPAARLALILRESTASQVVIEVDDTTVSLNLDRSNFKLPTASASEYPAAKEFPAAYETVKANALSTALSRTVFCCDPDSSRFALGGILLEREGDILNVVGTDGRRLAHAKIGVEGETDRPTSPVVPQPAANALSRLLSDTDEEVRIALTMNDIAVQAGDTTMWSRLVEGRYPNWRQVLPDVERYQVRQSMQVRSLLSGLRQAAIVSDAESRGVDFRFENDTLILTAKTADLGNSKIELPIEAVETDAITLRLDHRFVADFLRACGEEQVTVNVNSTVTPMLLQAEGYAYVVMPMSLDG